MADLDLSLDDLAHDLLNAVVAWYPTDGQFALPKRRYVADASPAWDDPQVTVQLLRTYAVAGDPNVEVTTMLGDGYLLQLACEFGVQIVRCRATLDDQGNYPPVSAIESNARAVHADALAVFNGARAAHKAGNLSGCGGVGFGGWQAVEPSDMTGGLALVRLLLE